MVAAAFEYIKKALNICVNIGMRVNQRVTNARLCSKINHSLRSMLLKECGHAFLVFDTEAYICEIIESLAARKASLLKTNIIIIVKVINANNLVASLQKFYCEC